VIHNIALPPYSDESNWVRLFFNGQLNQLKYRQRSSYHAYFKTIATLKVSAHFYISRQGRTVQCVPLHRRAWHAGASFMNTEQGLRHNLNHTSIGIELAGSDDYAFTLQQYRALTRLIIHLFYQRQMSLKYITGHSDIAPKRKTDPGPCFNWQYLNNSLPNFLTQQLIFRP
jgi:AmpD protein